MSYPTVEEHGWTRLVRIYFGDGCARFREGFKPYDDERRLLDAVVQALPDTLEAFKVNNDFEFVRIGEGYNDKEGPWVEFHQRRAI